MKPSKALTIKKHEAQLRVYGGVNFFNSYGPLLQQNPNNISTYIYWFLSNPSNINFAPINFRWEPGPKY